jgi:hypothetical protein
MAAQTQADLFPLIQGGGVFLLIVGAAIVIGGLQFKWRNRLLGAGAALATVATIATAPHLATPHGAPTMLQVGSLGAAVLLEVLTLVWAIRRFAPQGQRPVTIAVLLVVGVHFVIMAPAFGPLIIALGILCVSNAVAGLRIRTYSLRTLWAMDGLIKLGVGAAMLLAPSLPCLPCR